MSRLGAKVGRQMKLAQAVAAAKGEVIVQPEVIQHLGKRADAPLVELAQAGDTTAKLVLENRKAFTGCTRRRVIRRGRCRLTAVDLGLSLESGDKKQTPGKRAKLRQARFVRYVKQVRLLSGLLCRATGIAAPALIGQADYVMPAYQRSIGERGTSISKPNLRSNHGTI